MSALWGLLSTDFVYIFNAIFNDIQYLWRPIHNEEAVIIKVTILHNVKVWNHFTIQYQNDVLTIDFVEAQFQFDI